MATSKTLKPTNVTIQIPAFADKPDQRLNSNCLDKEADAINALSDNKANLVQRTIEANATLTLTFSAYATYAIFFCGYVETSRGLYVGTCDTTSILYKVISGATDFNITSSGRTISITNNGQYSTPFRMLLFSGTAS